jgi:KRAB domain-containing zinc finger protein
MVYNCSNCNKVYKTKKCLEEHINVKHSKVQSSKCEKCDKYFENKFSLKRHLYNVHPSKLHSCTFCGSSFKVSSSNYFGFYVSLIGCIYFLTKKAKRDRDQHITSVHTGEKYYQCKICPSNFCTKGQLKGK